MKCTVNARAQRIIVPQYPDTGRAEGEYALKCDRISRSGSEFYSRCNKSLIHERGARKGQKSYAGAID